MKTETLDNLYIWICWFGAQDELVIINHVEKCCAA